jgi:hypothetical protein
MRLHQQVHDWATPRAVGSGYMDIPDLGYLESDTKCLLRVDSDNLHGVRIEFGSTIHIRSNLSSS